MSGAGWLNLGSLLLGLIAWALPVIGLMRRNKPGRGRRVVFSAVSFGACAVSLCMQLFYTDHLVKIEDWSALMDTSHATALAAATLLIVTVILNGIAWWVSDRKN